MWMQLFASGEETDNFVRFEIYHRKNDRFGVKDNPVLCYPKVIKYKTIGLLTDKLTQRQCILYRL